MERQFLKFKKYGFVVFLQYDDVCATDEETCDMFFLEVISPRFVLSATFMFFVALFQLCSRCSHLLI